MKTGLGTNTKTGGNPSYQLYVLKVLNKILSTVGKDTTLQAILAAITANSNLFGKYNNLFTASGSQKIFTTTNVVTNIDMIFVNGYNTPALIATTTITGNHQVTFASGFSLNDEVIIYYH